MVRYARLFSYLRPYRTWFLLSFVAAVVAFMLAAVPAQALLVTDPNDGRNWQGATVGTFANLVYGSNTLATRTQVVTNQLLDDGLFKTLLITFQQLRRRTGTDRIYYHRDRLRHLSSHLRQHPLLCTFPQT